MKTLEFDVISNTKKAITLKNTTYILVQIF